MSRFLTFTFLLLLVQNPLVGQDRGVLGGQDTTPGQGMLDIPTVQVTTLGKGILDTTAGEDNPLAQFDTTSAAPLTRQMHLFLQHMQQTEQPVKCLTPFIIAAENAPPSDYREALRLELAQMRSLVDDHIANIEYHFSPSGTFRFQYTRTGNNAVPLNDTNSSGVPDFVERAGEIADESYEYLVGTLGYRDFVLPGSFYEMRFQNINAYGFTQSVGTTTTFIVIHNNFQGFPPNDSPEGNAIGAMKVTIAHEMMHAIQFAYNNEYWANFNISLDWLEMDATMMEEIVYDEVNDYYNYIRGNTSIFGRPNGSTPVAYDHVTWSLYFAESVGIDFWVSVWEELATLPRTANMPAVMRDVLAERNLNFDDLFTENHAWHYASGNLTLPGFGFEEAAFYPTPSRIFRLPVPDSLIALAVSSNPRAAQYLVIDDLSNIVGEMAVTVEFTGSAAGVALIGRFPDGSFQYWQQSSQASAGTGAIRITTDVQWQELTSLAIIFANPTNSIQQMSYKLEARELPERLTLTPNYPNPFNAGTTIPFALPESAFVSLNVYDVTGRLVAELVNQELNRGFYDIPFTPDNLASGVYVYILRAGRNRESGKMLLLK
ncbi:MAG: T9SS type A sorting domain-containing protein [Bacteroidetes bacterium]|nr:T9SS type A sorting domain-containing protein [Bacteroidota bacterium]MCH8524615.1 T9SS type A sorting domain-containing protein [Balneolales bacterium]